MDNIDKTLINVIKEAVVTVPGVSSFANYNAESPRHLSTLEIDDAVEFTKDTENLTRFRIHVILLGGVNIKDVVNEVQIRVKYELEKKAKFSKKFLVDVVIDDIMLI